MKTNKREIKIEKYLPNLLEESGNLHVKDVLAFFLVFLFFVYGGLFFLYGRKIIAETGNFTFPKNPSIEEIRMKKMVKGQPISKMIPHITKKHPETARFLIAIAKKESNWGKYSPKKGKKECFNYWGYRGMQNPTSSGYSCFDSEKQAVDVVGRRLDELIEQGIDTPEKMVIWKCGGNCAENPNQSEEKWIRDVGYYYKRINSS